MVDVPLIFGRLTAADYEDELAHDARIDALRDKIECVEDPQFTRDYHDPDKRSIANALTIEFADGSKFDEVVVEYPIGHKRRRFDRLPVSIRIVLEAVRRNYDGKKIAEEHIEQLANWKPNAARVDEIPFVVSRVVLQDFTGVPLLAAIAAMRGVAKRTGKNPKSIEPLVPVDLVVDHSVQVDFFRQ